MSRIIRSLSYSLLVTLCVVYAFGYIFWRILFYTPAYELWQIQLSEVFGSWFYLPLLPLLILAISFRNRRAAITLIIPLLFFVNEYGRQYLPKWHLALVRAESSKTLRVMSWNTLYTSDADGLFEAEVDRLQPDLLALQEVSYGLSRKLSESFNDRYPYQYIDAPGASRSVSILSRYPILDTSSASDLKWRACRCQQVKLDLNGTSVTVINAHPPSPYTYYDRRSRIPRIRQFNAEHQDTYFKILFQFVEAVEGPLLLVGDLNTTERQPNYRRLRAYLEDAHATAGWGMGYTYPSTTTPFDTYYFPFIRIDHILHSQEWVAFSAWTGEIAGSDHRYVAADMMLASRKPD